ncbi:hypothetical protein KCU81_g136, partial [Aureobasidium melanogenum]
LHLSSPFYACLACLFVMIWIAMLAIGSSMTAAYSAKSGMSAWFKTDMSILPVIQRLDLRFLKTTGASWSCLGSALTSDSAEAASAMSGTAAMELAVSRSASSFSRSVASDLTSFLVVALESKASRSSSALLLAPGYDFSREPQALGANFRSCSSSSSSLRFLTPKALVSSSSSSSVDLTGREHVATVFFRDSDTHGSELFHLALALGNRSRTGRGGGLEDQAVQSSDFIFGALLLTVLSFCFLVDVAQGTLDVVLVEQNLHQYLGVDFQYSDMFAA